jgi:hypothetical protein
VKPASTLNSDAMPSARPGALDRGLVAYSTWIALGLIAAALAVRIAYAGSCYLNPDEAQHFDAARPASLFQVFLASHRLAHPPLFVFVLHAFLVFGRSELILRLPSILGGTAALWLTFAWLRRGLGAVPALTGLLFMAVSPAAISASTEVRQYGLLLCFLCGALYATDRALTERSIRWAVVQGLFLLGALLTHYTSTVAILSIDIYVLFRCIFDPAPRRLLWAFLGAQMALGTVLTWLYFDYVRGAEVFSTTSLLYLRRMVYVPSSESLADFSRRAFIRTFAYTVSENRAIRAFIFLFLAGVLALAMRRTKAPRLWALLTICPFAVGFITALCRVFPFAGSRHQTYLLPFLAAGYAAAVAWIPRKFAAPLLLACIVLSPFWIRKNPPDNNRGILSKGDINAAVEQIHRGIPESAPLFLDDETYYMLRYYLGRYDPRLDSYRHRMTGESFSGHPIVASSAFGWAFLPGDALAHVNDAAKALGLPVGTSLWMVSDPWPFPPLAPQLPAEKLRSARSFGEISIVETTHY